MKAVDRLTDELISMDYGFVNEYSPKVFKLKEGIVVSYRLYKDENLHCIRSYLSKGAIFPPHEHKEPTDETLILYSGKMSVIIDDPEISEGKSIDMIIGKPYFFRAGDIHMLHAKEESWILSTLIPPDKNIKI
jgi:quercetin dioxygenase-like cupin family protein